jgi:UDP-glucose 4-epimerase
MRVVVVGASGNAGTSVLEALAHEDRVREIVGVARRKPKGSFAKTTWRTADISDHAADLRGIFAGADCVVHLAWLIQPSRDESITHATNVEGSQHVFDAVAAAGVPALVYASSVGAYAAGPKDHPVDESWPTTGIESSFYSRHKASVERILDSFEAANPRVRVVRLRPGLIFKRAAATGIRRLFAGPFLPSALVRRELIPVIPRHPRLVFQAVHSLDIGDAYRLAIVREDARGAYNVAADPVLDPRELARILGARTVPVPAAVLRAGADLTWRLRLQPTSPGWVDMGLGVPLMNTTRAREELGWAPRHTASEALVELIDGIRDGAGEDTPPLSPETTAPARVREVLTGVGRTSE